MANTQVRGSPNAPTQHRYQCQGSPALLQQFFAMVPATFVQFVREPFNELPPFADVLLSEFIRNRSCVNYLPS